MYKNKRYEVRKQLKQCFECGTVDARTESGKILCQACAERKARTQIYRNDVRKKKHLCVSCGKQDAWTLAGHVRCASCAAKNRMYCKRWNSRKVAEHEA